MGRGLHVDVEGEGGLGVDDEWANRGHSCDR